MICTNQINLLHKEELIFEVIVVASLNLCCVLFCKCKYDAKDVK